MRVEYDSPTRRTPCGLSAIPWAPLTRQDMQRSRLRHRHRATQEVTPIGGGSEKKEAALCATPFRCVVWRSCYFWITSSEQSSASQSLMMVSNPVLRLPPSILAMFDLATPLFSLSSICDISLPVLARFSVLHKRIRTCAVSFCSFLNVSFNSILLFGLSF